MATPTISEYTAHLRQDKVGMREYMRIAGVDTKESDTFTSLTEKVLNVAGAQRQVYVQPDEPQAKEGIWFQTEQLIDFDVVSDPAPFINEIFSSDTKPGYNPDSSNTGSRTTKYCVVNNVPYYLVFDQDPNAQPNNSYRFYRYNKEDNSYTLLQSYSASEIIAVREQTGAGGNRALAIAHGAVCIDDNQDYLYLIGGGNSTSVTADPTRKYVIRFGLKTHSISRVFTFAKPFFAIGGTSAWQCNCVMCGTKIYVFGYSDTNAGAYGPTAATKVIDLAAGDGTEYNKSNGPIFYGGTVLKFNDDLIVGFGGGASNFNSGQGMTHVRLFSTQTETTRTICYLTNEVNQRAICAVGNLIYFAEYTRDATNVKNFGCVNLENYTVRYINKGSNPAYSAISTSTPYYDKDLNCIMFGSYVGTKYPFVLTTKDYTRDTVVIFQASYETAAYKTNIFTTNNFKSDVKLGFSNAWLYKADTGIDKTIKKYYGTGTEWKEITEANAFGGIIDAPILQNKTVEIIENGTTNITADEGFDGLGNVEVVSNVVSEPVDFSIKVDAYTDNSNEYFKEITIGGNVVPFRAFRSYSTSSSYYSNGAKLEKVTINEGITEIGHHAFYNCTMLKDVVFPKSLKKIGGLSFFQCNALNVKTIPENTINIDSAFSKCTGLIQMSMNVETLNKDISGVGSGAFNACTNLRAVWIGPRMQQDGIGFCVFADCTNLKKIFIDLPRATVESFTYYYGAWSLDAAPSQGRWDVDNSAVVCNDDEGFMTKEEFDAIDWSTYTGE